MKISVITLQNVSNYGSVLQAYATQIFFEKTGCEVEFVDYWRNNMIDSNIAESLVDKGKLKGFSLWGNNKCLKRIIRFIFEKKIALEAEPFRQFVKKHLHTTEQKYIGAESLKKNPPKADIYCVGSDQVWNSDWNGGFDEAFYLTYSSTDKPKIAFSSSFGVDKLELDESIRVKELLEEFQYISVREHSAKILLKNINIANVEHILDPTLLINKKDWEKIIEPKPIHDRPYILVYQLNSSAKFDETVSLSGQVLGCPIVRIEYRKTDKEGINVFRPSIERWVSLFYYADYVITDSFHATAFSINFHKKFAVILPDKFATRIVSILNEMNLEERMLNEPSEINLIERDIDYNSVEQKLNEERVKVNQYYKFMEKTDED